MANYRFQVTLYYGEKRDLFRVDHYRSFPERSSSGIYEFYTMNGNEVKTLHTFPTSRCYVEFLGEVEDIKDTTSNDQREFVVNTVRGIES